MCAAVLASDGLVLQRAIVSSTIGSSLYILSSVGYLTGVAIWEGEGEQSFPLERFRKYFFIYLYIEQNRKIIKLF